MNFEKFYINKCIKKMSKKSKDIDIKNCTYYFFNDITDIKSFDPCNINIVEKLNKNIFIHYIGYVAIN